MTHADGRTEALTALEQRLLAFFVKNAGRIVSRQELLREVWGVPDRVPTRTLDIAISRLRAKIEPDPANPRYLVTHRGLGYRYEARRRGSTRPHGRIETEAGWLDLERRTVRTRGVESTLGDREADLLSMLLEHPGEPVAASELLHALWGRGLDTGRVRTALSRLRHKLEKDPAQPRHLVTTADGVVFHPLSGATPEHRTNLVPAPGVFIGRVDAMRRATSEVRGGRTVLVRGGDGIGKTRLLIEVGLREAVAQRVWPGGVWWVSAAGCTSVDELAARLGEVLGLSLPGPSGVTPSLRLIGALRRWGRCLLLIDDADDGSVAVGSFLARLNGEVGDIGFLVAGRKRLGIRGGYDLPLQSLTPGDAERVLIDRLEAAAPGALSGDATIVSRIAARLDGVPLAIELAAGQAAMVGDRRLLESLGWGRPLAGATPPSPALDAAISASWSLLPEREARLLRELSVWKGSFGLAEAQAVSEPGVFVPELLQSLVNATLVRTVPGLLDLPQRYTLLAPLRAAARRRLKRAGDEDAVLIRQREWLVEQVESLAAELDGSNPSDALVRLRALRDDTLEVARRWRRLLPALSARLLLAHWRSYQWTRSQPELVDLLRQAEEAAEASGDHLLHARAVLTRSRGGASALTPAQSLQLAARGRDMARAAGDPVLEAFGHLLVGVALGRQGRLEASNSTLERARQLLEGRGESDLEARVWMATAATARRLSGSIAALAAHRRAVLVAQLGGCRATLVRAHLRLGWELLASRKWKVAARELQDALDAASDLPWPEEQARVLGMLGRATLEYGDLDRTERWVEDALDLERRSFPDLGAIQPRNTLGLLRIEQGRYREAEEEGQRMSETMERYQFGDVSQPMFLRALARLVGGRPGAAALFEQLAQRQGPAVPVNVLETQLCLAAANALEGNETAALVALDRARGVYSERPELAGADRNVRMVSALVRGEVSSELRSEAAGVGDAELGFLGRVFRSLINVSH